MMDRRDLLKAAGLAGIASLLPWKKTLGNAAGGYALADESACVLIPQETEGPYPLDTVSNSELLRQDITGGKTGVPLKMRLKIIGSVNCAPIQNAWVKIWHCDKDGYYSGYTNQGYLGTQNNAGQTFCRGVQVTDANGEVEFITIFPGWYTGRVTHIHFRVYLSSVLTATSQLTFPVDTKNAIYTSSPLYSVHNGGPDPQTFASDNVFSDGYALQMATLTPDSATGGYDSYLEVTINGTGTAGLQNMEPETGGQFKLLQNYPNPYTVATTIPFTLGNTSDVTVELFDLSGKKVAVVQKDQLAPGAHEITVGNGINGVSLGPGGYIYQISVTNGNGTFRQCKMMTAARL